MDEEMEKDKDVFILGEEVSQDCAHGMIALFCADCMRGAVE